MAIESKLGKYLGEERMGIHRRGKDPLRDEYLAKLEKILQVGDDKMQRAYENMSMQIQQLEQKWEKATENDWYETVVDAFLLDVQEGDFEFLDENDLENLTT